MSPPTIAILSIGEMGLGVASLLRAHGFRVATTLHGRSEATHKRAASGNIEVLADDATLIEAADVLLSIVPPRDAVATAERVRGAMEGRGKGRERPLWFLDLNAMAPSAMRGMGEMFAETQAEQGDSVRFIDGGIIGGAPKRKGDGNGEEWSKPSIVVSGPYRLEDMQPDGARLAEVLNLRHVSSEVGKASGLKMCFASMTKGFTSIAVQSFTTAHTLGVLPQLQELLTQYSPKTGQLAEAGLTGMPPKAYRWVNEMEQIGITFREEGGFEVDMFAEVAKVYDLVAHGTALGEERTEKRVRGRSGEDVAVVMREGILKRKSKTE